MVHRNEPRPLYFELFPAVYSKGSKIKISFFITTPSRKFRNKFLESCDHHHSRDFHYQHVEQVHLFYDI